MASRRILTKISKHTLLLLLTLSVSLVLIISCGTTSKSRNNRGDNTSSSSSGKTSENTSEELAATLSSNRSNLSDVFGGQENDMPDVFLEKSNARDIGDPNQGYRIQILSTQNVQEADSLANDFRFWADSAMTNYIPKAYVFFKQPYYKVHIGNFQFQVQAQKLNSLIKARYPGAWVVHDEIDPELVPADTTSFKIKQRP